MNERMETDEILEDRIEKEKGRCRDEGRSQGENVCLKFLKVVETFIETDTAYANTV